MTRQDSFRNFSSGSRQALVISLAGAKGLSKLVVEQVINPLELPHEVFAGLNSWFKDGIADIPDGRRPSARAVDAWVWLNKLSQGQLPGNVTGFSFTRETLEALNRVDESLYYEIRGALHEGRPLLPEQLDLFATRRVPRVETAASLPWWLRHESYV